MLGCAFGKRLLFFRFAFYKRKQMGNESPLLKEGGTAVRRDG